MLKSFIHTAIRHLSKNRIYTFINVAGLTMGISAALFIVIYIQFETSFDQNFYPEGKAYRLIRHMESESRSSDVGVTSGPFAEALINDFPGLIRETLRVSPNNALMKYGDKVFLEQKVFLADSNFFHFFNLPLLKGNPEKALTGNSLVISDEMAKKYFGDQDPINKILQLDNQYLFTVSGVFSKKQLHSHLDFDFLGSIQVLKSFRFFTDWWSNSFSTYFFLEDGVDVKEVEEQFPQFVIKYFGEDMKKGLAKGLSLKAEPIHDIYFNNETGFDFVLHGSKRVVLLFAGIAILVLLIAIFNFVNLCTAMAASRYTEIGIRKTSGASRFHLMLQFLMESVFLVFLSSLLAFLLLELMYPFFIQMVVKNIPNPFSRIADLIIILGTSIIIGTLAGLYPAFILSGYSPKAVLKSKPGVGQGGQLLRKGMVILQFSFSIFLILATWITWDQLKYVQYKDLGFDYDHRLTFPINNSDVYEKRVMLKERLLQLPGVENVTLASGEPGGFHDFNAFEVEGQDEHVSLRTVFTDFDYLKTFDIELIAGRDFNSNIPSDSLDAAIINEKAASDLGWTPEEALGKWIKNQFVDKVRRRIIGVVKNYNFRSLKEKIDPLILTIGDDNRVGIVRFKAGELQPLIAGIRNQWDAIAKGFPFEFSFLDDQINRLYNDEQRQAKLFLLFGGLAIFIACMGLFALSMLAASRRMKEMAIRKVHGARMIQVISLINKEFLVLVLAGTFLMIPFGIFLMQRWLQNFQYHIDLSAYYFFGTALLAAIIAVLTVSYQAIKVARSNPAGVLRYE